MEKTKDIIVVGSIAFDDVQTIKGKREKLLGGSGTYFSLAGSLFTNIHLVGVVGEDFPNNYIMMFNDKGISTDYLIKEKGETFHWGGVYSDDFSTRDTLFTKLGVFENFQPQITDSSFDAPILFLANIQPSLQNDVINQIDNASLTVLDTMNLWIDNNYNELLEVIKKCDILLINDEEIMQLTKNNNLESAAYNLLDLGLRYVIVKQGGAGSLIISNKLNVHIPAVPNLDVVDPTGAGDSFAGAFLGYLASNSNNIIDAVITASALASYTVSEFGIGGIQNLELHNIEKRVKLINNLIKDL